MDRGRTHSRSRADAALRMYKWQPLHCWSQDRQTPRPPFTSRVHRRPQPIGIAHRWYEDSTLGVLWRTNGWPISRQSTGPIAHDQRYQAPTVAPRQNSRKTNLSQEWPCLLQAETFALVYCSPEHLLELLRCTTAIKRQHIETGSRRRESPFVIA